MLLSKFLKRFKRTAEFWWFERTFPRRFNFYTTVDPDELEELYQLRYRVYCQEFRYLNAADYPEFQEKDKYDKQSVHFVLRDSYGEIAATLRLISNSPLGFPLENNFRTDLEIPNKNRDKFVEVSRFIVAKKYRKKLIILALLRGIYSYLRENSISHVYAVLDDTLIKTLIKMGFPFRKIGPTSAYQGLTAPYIMDVTEMVENMQKVNPRLLSYAARAWAEYDDKKHQYTIH